MLRNYLAVALRNFFKHKLYSAINIIGLGLGIACVILILLFIRDQFQYDAQHTNRDRIYRVMREVTSDDGQKTFDYRVSGPVAPALARDFPEIETAIRVMMRTVWIEHKEKSFRQIFGLVDPDFLNIFNFPLVRGDKTALLQPKTVFITQSAAKRYFGNSNPIGETISTAGGYIAGEYTIVGIIHDVPKHSTLRFDFLSMSSSDFWGWHNYTLDNPTEVISVYVLLKEGFSAASVAPKLPAFVKRHMAPVAKSLELHLYPLKDVYLYWRRDFGLAGTGGGEDGVECGDITQIYTTSFLAIFILLIACINFTNLTTARSINRAKEVSLRKVVGADRSHVAFQFLGESFVMALISLIVAICIVDAVLPSFNAYTGNQLVSDYSTSFILQLIGLVLVVSFIAGSYPALYLSKFQPDQILKGPFARGAKGGFLRKMLVVFQFGVSIVLVILTVLAYQQITFIQNKSLGFEKENIVEVRIFWEHRNSPDKNHVLWMQYNTVKDAFLKHPNIKEATISRFYQGRTVPLSFFYIEGKKVQMKLNEVDEDFIPFFGIQLLEGRNFTETSTLNGLIAAGRTWFVDEELKKRTPEPEYILSEMAVKQLGWTDPIGKKITLQRHLPGRVVGVVKNFHVDSLHEPLQPIILYATNSVPKTLYLKISSENLRETVAFMKKTWEHFLPSRPFAYTFLDENLARLYEEEAQFRNAMGFFSLLAIFVATLGLLGFISFMAEKRSKEVGIRKVFGASETKIVSLLLTESFKLVAISCVLAWPIAYLVIDAWLREFTYRIDITIFPFLLGGVCALALSFSLVIYQALKAARTNPIDVLRYE